MSDKPKIFKVTRTPKGLNNELLISPESINQHYCAVINVSDSQCATFDYTGHIPSFWFPINEIKEWGHSPFFGTLRIVNQYYKGDKPVLLHCHAGANRSPSIAYTILLAKGYSPQEAEQSLEYKDLTSVVNRNVERGHIPKNIIPILQVADTDSTMSLHMAIRKFDLDYDKWSQQRFDEQNDYTLKSDSKSPARLVYNKEHKRFIIVKNNE